jgi:hypothetical protein
MTKLASMIALAASVSVASLAALQSASAQTYRHYPARGFQTHNVALGGGYYGGGQANGYNYDRASSPYAGGGGA